MKQISSLAILLICMNISCYAQNKKSTFFHDKLTIEPAVGTKMATLAGGTLDIQPAIFVQYNLFPKLNFILHTSTSFDIKSSHFNNIKVEYNYTSSQKIGVGTTFFSRKTANSFYLAGGAKHYMYSAKMNNKHLAETTEVDIDKWYADWGLLYAFKLGKKRIFFTSHIFLPLSTHDTGYNLIENMTIEIGIGMKIK